MADPFRSPKRMITRANEHINQFKAVGKGFLEQQPWARVVEPNADGTEDHVKIKLSRPFPEELESLAFEAAVSLRSALDQAAFATVHHTLQATAKSTYFPLADSAAGLEDTIKRGCKHLNRDIVAFFRALKPYKGGNDVLWSLNKVANATKHKLLVPVAVTSGGMFIHHMANRTSGGMAIRFPRWDSEKNELIFAKTLPGEGDKIDHNIQFSFGIAFGKVEGVGGHDALGTLRQFVSEVESVVAATQAEAQRLGLI
jgi:hypothetical protein